MKNRFEHYPLFALAAVSVLNAGLCCFLMIREWFQNRKNKKFWKTIYQVPLDHRGVPYTEFMGDDDLK